MELLAHQPLRHGGFANRRRRRSDTAPVRLLGKRVDTPTPDELKGHGLGYTGHEDEDDLGLVNMGGRQYDPRIGRVTTADPCVQARLSASH